MAKHSGANACDGTAMRAWHNPDNATSTVPCCHQEAVRDSFQVLVNALAAQQAQIQTLSRQLEVPQGLGVACWMRCSGVARGVDACRRRKQSFGARRELRTWKLPCSKRCRLRRLLPLPRRQQETKQLYKRCGKTWQALLRLWWHRLPGACRCALFPIMMPVYGSYSQRQPTWTIH